MKVPLRANSLPELVVWFEVVGALFGFPSEPDFV
jgi:hypothetical protein